MGWPPAVQPASKLGNQRPELIDRLDGSIDRRRSIDAFINPLFKCVEETMGGIDRSRSWCADARRAQDGPTGDGSERGNHRSTVPAAPVARPPMWISRNTGGAKLIKRLSRQAIVFVLWWCVRNRGGSMTAPRHRTTDRRIIVSVPRLTVEPARRDDDGRKRARPGVGRVPRNPRKSARDVYAPATPCST